MGELVSNAFDSGLKPAQDCEQPACPIVEIHLRPARSFQLGPWRYAVCAAWPEAAIREFDRRLNWTWSKIGAIAAEIAGRYNLPGFVVISRIWGNREIDLVVPPPFQMAFEPFRLDDRDPTLLAVCSQVLGRPVRPPRLSRKAELCIGGGVWTVFCLFIIFHSKPPWLASLRLAFLSLVPLLDAARSRSWRLTPDGIDVDGVRYTPVDTILVIEPIGRGGCRRRVSLHRAGTRRARVLSRLQCTAVLAVWQAAAQGALCPASASQSP